ncbi:Hypothetical protein LSJ_3080 (plasmid) [Ligilactobacillus salivarius]|uniref:Uncharacterized protein n=1 Tax=Ligilactobacillus salivarius TaxID=1624 RepID=A0A089RZ28_9LACO|nr:Hypothetical protein LSJ_3080 [Ligilactobacillus salivarius]
MSNHLAATIGYRIGFAFAPPTIRKSYEDVSSL